MCHFLCPHGTKFAIPSLFVLRFLLLLLLLLFPTVADTQSWSPSSATQLTHAQQRHALLTSERLIRKARAQSNGESNPPGAVDLAVIDPNGGVAPPNDNTRTIMASETKAGNREDAAAKQHARACAWHFKSVLATSGGRLSNRSQVMTKLDGPLWEKSIRFTEISGQPYNFKKRGTIRGGRHDFPLPCI